MKNKYNILISIGIIILMIISQILMIYEYNLPFEYFFPETINPNETLPIDDYRSPILLWCPTVIILLIIIMNIMNYCSISKNE